MKGKLFALVIASISLIILVIIIVGWPGSEPDGVAESGCLPRPQKQTTSPIKDYWEPTRRISFYVEEEDLPSDTQEFGHFSRGILIDPGCLVLWVDDGYDFNEVLNYLEFWPHCRKEAVRAEPTSTVTPQPTPTYDYTASLSADPYPTPTLEPGVRITPGPMGYSGCDDGETLVQAKPTPTPEISSIFIGQWLTYIVVEDGKCYSVPECYQFIDKVRFTMPCSVEYGHRVSCIEGAPVVTPIPTPTPEIYLEIEWPTGPWLFTPGDEDTTLEIDWRGDIIVTDALSQTVRISGPATVQFAESSVLWLQGGTVDCTDYCYCPPCPKAISIRNHSESAYVIIFDAEPNIAARFTEFGRLHHTTSGWYELYIDRRYNFREVLAYLRWYPLCR